MKTNNHYPDMNDKEKYTYQYNRNDRLGRTGRSEDTPPASKGIFKGNRSLAIILIDILLLLFIYGIFRLVLIGSPEGVAAKGFSFDLSGFYYEKEAYLTLTIKKEKEIKERNFQIVSARFYQNKRSEGKTIRELLPQDVDEKRKIYTVLENVGKNKPVKAEVIIGDTRLEIETTLKE